MHPTNLTIYQLIKYHIELTEAMEYTLITYKYDENELIERFKFLKEDYKKGFYHKITSKLFKKSKKLTKEIKDFWKTYNKDVIQNMVSDHNLHTRIEYNKKLYLSCACSNNILQVFLKEEAIKKDLDDSLITLVETTNKHFNLFCLFNLLNLFVSSKAILLEGDSTYILNDEDKQSLITFFNSFKDDIEEKEIIKDTSDLLNEAKTFNDEEAYELLNKISIECTKSEKQLYTDFESFTNKLEKDIEKGHN